MSKAIIIASILRLATAYTGGNVSSGGDGFNFEKLADEVSKTMNTKGDLKDKDVAFAAKVWLAPMKCAVKEGSCKDLTPFIQAGVSAAVSAIPTVGPFLAGLLGLLWPSESSVSVWDQVKDKVQLLIDKAAAKKEMETVESLLKDLKDETVDNLKYTHCSSSRQIRNLISSKAWNDLFRRFRDAAESRDLQENPRPVYPNEGGKTTVARRLLWSMLGYVPQMASLDIAVKMNILEQSWRSDNDAQTNVQDCQANLHSVKETATKYINFYMKAVKDYVEGVAGSATTSTKISPQAWEKQCQSKDGVKYPCERPLFPNPRDPKYGLNPYWKGGAEWVPHYKYEKVIYVHWQEVLYKPVKGFLDLAAELEAKDYCMSMAYRGIPGQSEVMGAKSFLEVMKMASAVDRPAAWRHLDEQYDSQYGDRVLCPPPPGGGRRRKSNLNTTVIV